MKNKKEKNGVKKSAVKSNLVKKLTLEVLNERHNALARYIGIPCVVEASEVFDGAAVMVNGSVVPSKEFACYRVDLEHFKGDFDQVRFRATSNGKDVAFAMLLGGDETLDYIAASKEAVTKTITIPLTPNSTALYVTMPATHGRPKWKTPKVELLCKGGGIIAQVNEALNTLLEKIQDLERRFEESLLNKLSEVNICLS